MYEALADVVKSFAQYQVVQIAVAAAIVLACVLLIKKGEKDRKSGGGTTNGNGNGVPSWTLYGPVKDAMDQLRAMAEQSRISNDLLRQMIGNQGDQESEQRRQTQLLEDIRNNQVMRMDVTTVHPQQPPPAARRRSSS